MNNLFHEPNSTTILENQKLLAMLEDGPIYLFDPQAVATPCLHFRTGFPGTAMYAIKANDSEDVINALFQYGITQFDIASLAEAQLVHRICPKAVLHLMNPVKAAHHITACYRDHGVRTFATDSLEETDKIAKCTQNAADVTCAVRINVPDGSAAVSISGKFGADPAAAAKICRQIHHNGQKAGLTFHVGGQCENPQAYAQAIKMASDIASASGVDISFLDVGGGFPARFGNAHDWLSGYFEIIRASLTKGFPDLSPDQIYCEPGRALVSETIRVVAQITLRRGHDLFLNEGFYGSLSEMPLLLQRVPIIAYRDLSPLQGATDTFSLFGPTCNNVDSLGAGYELPKGVGTGDVLKFESLGAYSLGLRTNFNGFYSDQIVPHRKAPQFKGQRDG